MDTLYRPGDIEREVAALWKKHNVPELARGKGGKPYFFMDGPPYATAAIHLGTAWNKILKDCYLRWLRMSGWQAWDQPGYDTHGTPIEVKVERELGFASKKDIEAYGIGKFVEKCREFATRNIETMSAQFADLGVWMGWSKPYLTLHNSYIEGAWHTFQKAHQAGLLYKGANPAHVCTRCETVVAYNEIEHRRLTDPAIYVKLRVKGNESLVVWTTTPWTLPANTGVMAHPDFEYARVEVDGEVLIVARDLVEQLMGKLGKEPGQFRILETVKGRELKGVAYEHPLKAQVPALKDIAHRVVLSSRYVTLETGTGLVHCAPGHGAEDFAVGKEAGLPVLCPVGLDGRFTADAGQWLAGKYAKQMDSAIIAKLNEEGALLKRELVTHEYPTCWRCETPLLLINVPQWFFRVTDIRQQLLDESEKVRWQPAWAGERFRDWLENLGDWPVSRQRYWGIPLPIWECGSHREVIGSFAELKAKAKLAKELDFHRPAIDGVQWKCRECGQQMRRIPDVLDVWFDAGVATWASLGYPRERLLFERLWPAKFEIEGPDQFRGWWNAQLITGALTFGRAPFESVLLHGFVLDAKGLKMSKSLGNVTSPEDVVAKHGRDVLRLYLLGKVAWEDMSFSWEEVREVQRALNILWNIANFVKSYAPEPVADATGTATSRRPTGLAPEDRWLLSRLRFLADLGRQSFEQREHHVFVNALREFIVSEFSRWYIKLVRDRVSPSAPDRAAQRTLRTALETLCALLAPIAPFVSEKIWQELFRKWHPEQSVHLLAWPEPAEARDEGLEQQMRVADATVEALNAARAEKGVKLRWPVQAVTVAPKDAAARKAIEALEPIVQLLGNAKRVEIVSALEGKAFEFGRVAVGEVLMDEAFVRELVRLVQELRKQAGLRVSERIQLFLATDGGSEKLLRARESELAQEVGAKQVTFGPVGESRGTLDFERRSVSIGLRKA